MNRKLFLLSLVAFVLTLAIAGCQREGCTDPKATNYDPDAKKDNGTCVYATSEPDPTDTIVIPTKEVFIDWGEGTYATLGDISIDSVRGYTKQADVKYVFLNYAPRDTLSPTGYTPDNFDYMINKLKCVIAVDSTKVRGTGIFYVGEGGTSVPDTISNISGMRSRQYEWFRRQGWEARKAMN